MDMKIEHVYDDGYAVIKVGGPIFGIGLTRKKAIEDFRDEMGEELLPNDKDPKDWNPNTSDGAVVIIPAKGRLIAKAQEGGSSPPYTIRNGIADLTID